MAFVVSARKYRPVRFDEVVGQEHVSQTLKKALQTDHVAHAFLFCGPRGVGKTTCARILAKVLNCHNVTKDFEPCGSCDSCRAFNENASFNIMELDAASNNSVDHIRTLVEQVRFQPQQGKYKIFIIDEVHMLSQSAFNAFLKTLEEPPPYAIFILATTEKHKIIPTILSRCQIFDFKRIQVKDVVNHLQKICDQEGIEADKDALHIIGQKADGALRDALSIFDRITSFAGKKITYEDVVTNLNILDYDYFFRFTDALLTEDLRQVMLIFDEVLRNGFEGDLFINGLAEHLRNLLVSKDEEMLRLLEVGESLKDRYRQQATVAPPSFILTALNLCNECDINYKMARNKRLLVEMTLIKMCFIGQAVQLTGSTSTPNAGAGQQQPQISQEKKTADVKAAPSSPQEILRNNAETPTGKTSATPPLYGLSEAREKEDSQLLTNGKVEEPATAFEKKEDLAPKQPVQLPEKDIIDPIPDDSQQSTSLRKPKNGSLPTLQTLDIMHAEMEEAEGDKGVKKEAKLTQEFLEEAWAAYIQSIDRDSVKAILKGAAVSMEEAGVNVVVGSALAESIVRQETGLMEFLRKKLHAPLLSLNLKLVPSRPNAVPAKPKVLSIYDKFRAMKEVNPLVEELRQRFDLAPENE